MSRTFHPRRRPTARDPNRHHIKDQHGARHRYSWSKLRKMWGAPRVDKPAERRVAGLDREEVPRG
jgi:hypothetical protein